MDGFDTERDDWPFEIVALGDAVATPTFTYSPGQAVRTRVLAIAADMVCSAAVATRQPMLELVDAAGVVAFSVPSPVTLVATNVAAISWAVGTFPAGSVAGGAIVVPIPRLWMPDGASWRWLTGAAGAGDTLVNVRVTVEQYPVRFE